MSYASLAQLIDRFGERMLVQLTDRESPPTAEVVEAVVDQALADTDAVIDGYLGGRYALPLATVVPLLVDLALAIAIYKLHPYKPDPKIEKDYDGALRMLRDIANGTIRLSAAGLEPEARGDAGVQTNDRERPFTDENMKGFI